MKRYQSVFALSVLILALGIAWSSAQAGADDPEIECENSEGSWLCEPFECYEYCYCSNDPTNDEYSDYDQGFPCGDTADYGFCDRPDECDGFGTCVENVEPNGTICYHGSDEGCDPDDFCDGTTAYQCITDPAYYYGNYCGDQTDYGECDRPDTCDGYGNCESNIASSSLQCHSGSNEYCDPDVFCTGNSTEDCPVDVLQYQDDLCGDMVDYGACDDPDTCDGNGHCLQNVASNGTICRSGSDAICDPAEVCSGITGDDCPVDSIADLGTPCGDPSSNLAACDRPDFCDGSGFCDPNPELEGTVCRPSVDDECDTEEVCNGITGDDCPVDIVESAGTSCGDPADYGLCDDPDTCDGSGYCDENIEPENTVCRPSVDDECDPEEVCSGITGDDCPVDSVEPVTTLCGDPTDYGYCDDPDTCDGSGYCDSNIEPAGTVCRPLDNVQCDEAELCSGISGDDCPINGFAPEFTPCGNGADTACTEPDSCDGQGACLPRNEACGLVTSSSLCTFDVQPDKGVCGFLGDGVCLDSDNEQTGDQCNIDEDCEPDETCGYTYFSRDGEACLIDPVCEAAGGVYCTPAGLCANADGDPLEGDIACTNECSDSNAYCKQTGQFRLLFTPDVKQYPAYKLPASNPGQTYYNAIVEGAPNTTQDLYLYVSYPYVTVGGQPVHVYDGADVVGACVDSNGETTPENCVTDADCGSGETCNSSCFAPGDSLAQYDIRWAIEDYFTNPNPDLDPRVSCDGDNLCGPAGSGRCLVFLEDVPIPGSGMAYVNIHLDHGLKGNWTDANLCDDSLPDRYDQGPSSGSLFAETGYDALINNDTQDGPVGIYNCTDYYFAHDDDAFEWPFLGVDVVQNLNVFKGISGVGGLAKGSLSGAVYGGLKLKLTPAGNPNTVLQSTTTDEDGYYVLPYKHKGKPSLYDVYLSDETETSTLGKITVELQGNGFSQVVFDSEDDPCDSEAAFCECNGWCAAAEYGSGRQSGGSDGGSSGGSCDLSPSGAVCTANSECCSGSCKGKPGNKVCK